MKKDKDLMMRIISEIRKCSKKFDIDEYYMMDYAQDAYIKVIESFDHGYKEEGKLDAWIRTVTMNYIRTRIKRDNKAIFCSFEDITVQKSLYYDTEDYDIKRKRVIELAMCAIEKLPPLDKLIVLKRMNNESCSSIAREMKLNIKTVHKHLVKSYDKMKDFISKKHYELYGEKLDW